MRVMKKTLQFLLKPNWTLIVILLLGLALRVWGINFGLPYTIAPDEPTHFSIGLRIFKTGDLNPHWLNYPSLIFYLNALALVPFYLIGKASGVFSTPADIPFPEIVTMGVGRLTMPSEFLFTRGVTALFGVGSVWLVYLIARELHAAKWVAWLAALLLAISPASVYNSHLIRPDTHAVFFALFSFLWARRILDNPSRWNYLWAGIGAGLATSAKYNMPLIFLPMVAAHFLRFGWRGIERKELYLGLFLSGLTFLLTTPYAVLDYPKFTHDMGFEVTAQAAGHAGFEGNTFPWYVTFLWTTEGILVIASVVEAVRLVWARSKNGLVLLSFSVVYFVFINQFIVRNDRTILPILPFLHLLAAMFVVDLHDWLANTQRVRRQVIVAGLAAVCALMLYQPVQMALAANIRLTQPDARDTSRVWLEANLPSGTRVAEEAYSPYIDTRRFVVQGIDAIVDRPPEWYIQNGFEYLVFSQGMFGRFFAEPERYATWVAKYSDFFARFQQIARFDDNGYEIRIYKTEITLPAQRVATRFGDYGDLVELVGYENVVPGWSAGEPLRVKLFWRTLRDAPEPLELALRLLGKDNREIAAARGDLLQGKGWPAGIFATEWTIPSQADAAPGVYRLEVNVIQARYAYRTPIKSWAEESIEALFLGPFKMSALAPLPSELQVARPASVQWSDEIALLGYIPWKNTLRAGNALLLTFYWQSLVKPSRDYTVFVHLLDSDGKLRAQVDVQPRGGTYPTSLWDAGEILRDDYSLNLPADLAPGLYRFEIGLYEYPNLTRLTVMDANGQALGDHWSLPDQLKVAQ